MCDLVGTDNADFCSHSCWLMVKMLLQPLRFHVHLTSDLSETPHFTVRWASRPQGVKQRRRVKWMSCHFALMFTSLCFILQIINLIDFFKPPFCHSPFLLDSLLSSPPPPPPPYTSLFSCSISSSSSSSSRHRLTIPFTGI